MVIFINGCYARVSRPHDFIVGLPLVFVEAIFAPRSEELGIAIS